MASAREIVVKILGDAKGATRAAREAEVALGAFGAAGEKANLGLTKVQDTLNKFGTIGKGASANLSKFVTGLSQASPVALAAGAGVAALGVTIGEMAKAGVEKFADLTEKVLQFQRVSGASAEESSRFVFALKSLNVDADAAGKALGILSSKIDSGALNKFHVQAAAADAPGGQLVATLLNVANAYNASTDTIYKNDLARAALGRGYQQLLPVLSDVQQFQQLMAQTPAGVVFSDAELERGEAFRIATKELQQSFGALEVSIGERIVPALTHAAEEAKKIIDYLDSGGKKGSAPGWLKDIDDFGNHAKNVLDRVNNTAQGFHDAIAGTLKGDLAGNSEQVKRGWAEMGATAAEAHNKIASSATHAASAEDLFKAASDHAQQGVRDLTEALTNQDPLYGQVKSVVLGVVNAQRDLDSANRGVTSATEGVSDAQYNLNQLLARGAVDAKAVAAAHKQVEESSRSVEHATKQLADAEQNLAEVERGATDVEKERADLQYRQSLLGQVGAQLRVAEAAKQLNDARAKADPLALAQANLSLQEAQLGVEDASLNTKDAQDHLNDVNGIGEAAAKRLKDAQDQVTTAQETLTSAQEQAKTAQENLTTAEQGDVNFSHEVLIAKRNVQTAEENLATAKQAVIDKSATLQEAQDAETKLLAVGGAGADLLVTELTKLVELYPQLKPILDQVIAAQRASTSLDGIPRPPAVTGVPGIGDGIGFGAALDGTDQSIIAAASTTGLPYTINSTYRPGAITSSGNLSLHAQHKAVDFGGTNAALNALFHDFEPYVGSKVREMFYSPEGYGYSAGTRYPNSQLPAQLVSDHYSHLHVGVYDRGGILPPGLTLALNKTGKNEYITDPQAPMGVRDIHLFEGANVVIDSPERLQQLKREIFAELRRNGDRTVSARRG